MNPLPRGAARSRAWEQTALSGFFTSQPFHRPRARQASAPPSTWRSSTGTACRTGGPPEFTCLHSGIPSMRHIIPSTKHISTKRVAAVRLNMSGSFVPFLSPTDPIAGTQSSSHNSGFCRKQSPERLVGGKEVVHIGAEAQGGLRIVSISPSPRSTAGQGALQWDGCSSSRGGQRALLSHRAAEVAHSCLLAGVIFSPLPSFPPSWLK